MAYLRELFESGALRPLVDRTFPMDRAPAAGRYVETGGKSGSVVLIMDEEGADESKDT